MSEALTRAQLTSAQRLLDRGLSLREISARLGVRFGAVCLGLFGGNQSTAASVSEPRLGMSMPGKDASRTVPQASHADNREVVTGPHRASGETNSGATGGRQLQPALRTGVASGVVDTEATETAPGGALYRLVSPHGESLHRSERVLTRLPQFFWRGDAEQLAAVRRRKPQWGALKPVAVNDSAPRSGSANRFGDPS